MADPGPSSDEKQASEGSVVAINPQYGAAQVERMATAPYDPRADRAAVAALLEDRTAAWEACLKGMEEGNIAVGSRNPTGAPSWVTLEVLNGGFASGRYLAELGADETPNTAYFGGEGAAHLSTLLDTGCYRINVPEEGAMLVMAYLLRNGKTDEARAIATEIAPWLSRLRFYPTPAETPLEVSPLVCVDTVADCLESMATVVRSSGNAGIPRVGLLFALSAAYEIWLPLEWEAFSLFAETVACDHCPKLTERDPATNRWSYEDHPGCPAGEACGWPCQQYPEGWHERAADLVARYKAAVKQARAKEAERYREICAVTTHYNRPLQSAFAMNKRYIGTAKSKQKSLCVLAPVLDKLAGSRGITGRTVGDVRQRLAGFARKHGLPGEDSFEAWRASVYESVPMSSTADYAKVIQARLSALPGDQGLVDPMVYLGPVTADENPALAGHEIPAGLVSKVDRCRYGTITELVEAGYIKSGETLATLVPAMSAHAISAGINDPVLRRLYYAVSVAFKKRRSLLLLNLESQVQMSELPWVAPLKARISVSNHREKYKRQLALLAQLYLDNFPFTIIPNKLLQSFRDLSDSAGVSIDFCDEIAADIYEGRFGEKFLRAAKVAAGLLEADAAYIHYFNLTEPLAAVVAMANSSELAPLCDSIAAPGGRTWSTAENGRVIETCQILTTHSLSGIVTALKLQGEMDWFGIAAKTFQWIVKSLATQSTDWRAQLQLGKNVGFAWRQLMFYATMHQQFGGDAAEEAGARLAAIHGAMVDYLASTSHSDAFKEHLTTTMLDPFAMAMGGASPEQYITGWVANSPHWILPPV